jgi:O-methyltransferase
MGLSKLLPSGIKNAYRKLYWLYNNHQQIPFFEQIKQANFYSPLTYHTDGLVTTNNCDFIKEDRFTKAYTAAAATNPWPGFTLQWRVYVVCWFANHVKNLPGDFVECGVNTGAYARAVIDYINFNSTGKTFFLLDTFEGMPDHLVNQDEKNVGVQLYLKDHYKNVYDQVKATFKDFNVKIIKGVVPDTLAECNTDKICYLSIDMNSAEPEIAAAEYFWNKVVPGGVVLLDDYGFPMHINQKKAFDDFAKRKGVEILCLPTGQGIIIKP